MYFAFAFQPREIRQIESKRKVGKADEQSTRTVEKQLKISVTCVS